MLILLLFFYIHIVIKKKTGKTLVGFISGIPVKVGASKKVVSMCEINFLCVNKRCRDKKLAPKLISEVTRRVNLTGIWQAVYTAGIAITSTIAQCQYWHRSLNPQKLIQVCDCLLFNVFFFVCLQSIIPLNNYNRLGFLVYLRCLKNSVVRWNK